MQTRHLGNSDLTITPIGIGAWAMGGGDWAFSWGRQQDDDSIAAIHAALDAGVNWIDTAAVYGLGHSEEVVGKAIAGRAQRPYVFTKCSLVWNDQGEIGHSLRAASVRRELEASLRRLRVDAIDLYQIHWPDPSAPIGDTADAMRRLLEQGKIRAIGVSNFSPEQMDAFRAVVPLHTNQPPYNLFERQIEQDVLPYTRRNSIGTLAYGALCRGLLSGKMRPDSEFTGDDLRKVDPKFRPPRYAQYLKAVERLDSFAREKYGKRVIHLAMRWLLDQPGVTVALWGARHPQQMMPMEDMLGWSLSADAMRAIDQILRETITDPAGPEFMAPPAREIVQVV